MIPKVENFIKNKIVNVFNDINFNGLAGTTPVNLSQNIFTVIYNKQKIEAMLKLSDLDSIIEYDELETAIMLHEYAHVLYSDFSKIMKIENDQVLHYIVNVLEDARIEYQFIKQQPTLSLYFEISLSTLKKDIEVEYNESNSKDLLKNELSEVYNIVRFGRCKRAIGKFESMVFCLNSITRRGTTEDVINASKLIYNLICEKLNSNRNDIKNNAKIKEDVTLFNKKDINDINSMKDICDSNDKKQGNNQKINTNALKAKILQQKNANNIEQNQDSENKIFNYVLANFGKEINTLRQMFKRILSTRMFIPSMDGEINLSKQQELYLSEKIGESGKYYKINKLAKEGADVIICRDVSGSTYNFKKQYAYIICIMLAALENLSTMRSCLIDFSSYAKIVKDINQKTKDCGINDFSDGGTHVCDALKLIDQQIVFQNTKRICIIVTDGEYADQCEFIELKKNLEKKYNIKFLEILISNNNGIAIEQLPSIISKFLMKELRV
jgi:uncharacterized protein with von Willebrand factor type A (vWA) domain